MTARSLGFRWIPFDGEWIFDEPGRFGVKDDSSVSSIQMSVLISIDLRSPDRSYDPESLSDLATRIESVQAGDPWPANIMGGVDGVVYFSQGVVLVASSVGEDSALLIEPDEFTRVIRTVHSVFAGPDFRNPNATFEDISFNVLSEGQEAIDEYTRRGGETTRWEFDPKKCTFTYEGQPEDFEYPNPIPPGYQELCE